MSPDRHLFSCYGVELEYMIVDRDTLDVRPLCDRVLYGVGGTEISEVERGALAWSNELVLHVIELKTNGPADTLDGLGALFHNDVLAINALLASHGAMLMPTSMHPWMDPHRETHLWPHEFNAIYQSFNRIFDCRGHGWSNVQCTHLNLPFSGDHEFGRLHAAIRLLLPVLPALCASSPIMDGRDCGIADARLEVYRTNARRVPAVTGRVIPEPLYTRRAYERKLLNPLYRDIAPHDPEGILQHEWLNARGAIARFDRETIEIRVLDIQECPQADVAVLHLICRVLEQLVQERWISFEEQCSWPTEVLADLMVEVLRTGDHAQLCSRDYLRGLGMHGQRCRVDELWQHLLDSTLSAEDTRSPLIDPLKIILEQGCLSQRIRRALAGNLTRTHLQNVYRRLCSCLHEGRMFHAC